MKTNLMLIAVLLALPACAAISGNRAAGPDDKLNAENRLMKNNLDLALRENRVLKEENFQHKAETTRLKKAIRGLHEDIDLLNRKYDTDVAGMTEQYNNISDQYTIFEESTRKKIQELTELNRNLDKKMKGEISRLNTRMAEQQADFEESRLSTEEDFTTRLSSMEALMAEKEAAIASMKARYDDALLQIENLKQEIDSYKAVFGGADENDKSPTEPNQGAWKTSGGGVNAAADITINEQPVSKPAASEAPAEGDIALQAP